VALDVLIPFAILLALTIYLIYSRTQFEKNIVSQYEEKFEVWKKHNPSGNEKSNYKELVGLIFKENDKINIELLNHEVKRRIVQGKFDIKE
jgi:hypothetical protein